MRKSKFKNDRANKKFRRRIKILFGDHAMFGEKSLDAINSKYNQHKEGNSNAHN
jgi:hypothetical protein